MAQIVIKRDGRKVAFDKDRIYNAIIKAMSQGSGIKKEKIAEDIATEIETELKCAIIVKIGCKMCI